MDQALWTGEVDPRAIWSGSPSVSGQLRHSNRVPIPGSQRVLPFAEPAWKGEVEGLSTFTVQGPSVALFRVCYLMTRQNRSAIPPGRAPPARKTAPDMRRGPCANYLWL